MSMKREWPVVNSLALGSHLAYFPPTTVNSAKELPGLSTSIRTSCDWRSGTFDAEGHGVAAGRHGRGEFPGAGRCGDVVHPEADPTGDSGRIRIAPSAETFSSPWR